MLHRICCVVFLLFLLGVGSPFYPPHVFAVPPPLSVMDPHYHRAQAARYRAEAERLEQGIRRYEIMVRVYSMGAEHDLGTYNPQGRSLMVERSKRIIRHFSQQQYEYEQLAAQHEALAQMLPVG